MTMFVPNRAALLTLVLASIILVGTVATSRAQPVPQEISYQGTLADAENGDPVNGPVDLTFRLYDGPGEGAAPLPPGSPWENVFTDVSVNSGRFGVLLGSGDRPPLLDVLLSSNGPLWLEVTVDPADGPEEALPRTKLTSTAFALRAEQAQQAQRVADGAAVRSLNGLTNAVTLSGGENISISQDGNTLTIAAAVPEGGLTAVTSDETLAGAGTSSIPLVLADGAVTTRSWLMARQRGRTWPAGRDIHCAVGGRGHREEGDNVTLSADAEAGTLTISAVVPEGGLSSVAVQPPLTGASENPVTLPSGEVVRSITAEESSGATITTLTDDAVVRAGCRIILGQEDGAITISVSDDVPSSEEVLRVERWHANGRWNGVQPAEPGQCRYQREHRSRRGEERRHRVGCRGRSGFLTGRCPRPS